MQENIIITVNLQNVIRFSMKCYCYIQEDERDGAFGFSEHDEACSHQNNIVKANIYSLWPKGGASNCV